LVWTRLDSPNPVFDKFLRVVGLGVIGLRQWCINQLAKDQVLEIHGEIVEENGHVHAEPHSGADNKLSATLVQNIGYERMKGWMPKPEGL
jgi:hypothetical protein